MIKTEVQEQNGLVALQFINFSEGYKSFHYARADKVFASHGKWKAHTQAMRYRRHIVMLTALKPSNGKSGASYDVIGPLCLLENDAELQMVNEQYWSALRKVQGDEQKLECTWEFVTVLRERMNELGRGTAIIEPTYQYLQALYLQLQGE